MAEWAVYPGDAEPPAAAAALAEQVERDGGQALAIYREPVGDHWQIFCLLPMSKVDAHALPARPLARPRQAPARGGEEDRPLRGPDRGRHRRSPGVYWTPNGHHRRAVLAEAQGGDGARHPRPGGRGGVPDPGPQHREGPQPQGEVARGHPHVPRRSPRSSRAAARRTTRSSSRRRTSSRSGLLYEKNKRFAGGAFAPILRRVDKFLDGTFAKTLPEREERAEKVREADEALGQVVAQLKKRGIRHPFVKNYVLARTTPLTRARKTLPSLRPGLREAARRTSRRFDVEQGALRRHPAGGGRRPALHMREDCR